MTLIWLSRNKNASQVQLWLTWQPNRSSNETSSSSLSQWVSRCKCDSSHSQLIFSFVDVTFYKFLAVSRRGDVPAEIFTVNSSLKAKLVSKCFPLNRPDCNPKLKMSQPMRRLPYNIWCVIILTIDEFVGRWWRLKAGYVMLSSMHHLEFQMSLFDEF